MTEDRSQVRAKGTGFKGMLIWLAFHLEGNSLHTIQAKKTKCRRVRGFPGGSDGEESACSVGDLSSILGSGRSPGGGHGSPLQCSCLGESHGRGRSLAGYSPWGCRVRHDWVTKHSTAQGDRSISRERRRLLYLSCRGRVFSEISWRQKQKSNLFDKLWNEKNTIKSRGRLTVWGKFFKKQWNR